MTKLRAQILANRFAALAREGAETFRRMARSPLVIDEGHYAAAILDADARLVAQDQGEPSQLCAVQATVAYLIDAFAFNIAEGDVIVAGDPYCGGTWGGVLTIAVPVFHDGDLRFVTAVRFAAADLAGNVPGPFQPDAHEIWQEALRLTPVKLWRANAPQKDVRAYLLKNTRAPDHLDSDLTTATVAARAVAGKLAAMIEAVGLPALTAAVDHVITYGRARTTAHLAAEIAGRAAGSATAGAHTVQIELDPVPTGLRIDLAGSSHTDPGAANLTLAATRAIVLVELAGDLIDDIGISQGVIDAIELTVPADCCLAATFPAAVSLGWRVLAPLMSAALATALKRAAGIAPPGPLLMLFDTIGTTPVTVPIALSPGFSPAPGLAGGDAASGRRQLVSAEEVEAAQMFRLVRREIGPKGILVDVHLTGSGLEGIVVPGGLNGQPVIRQQTPLARERSNVLSLAPGAAISFAYARREGFDHADA